MINFIKRYQPTYSKHTGRSILLKSTKTHILKSDTVISHDGFKSLYYNKSLNGWITSCENSQYFEKQGKSSKDVFTKVNEVSAKKTNTQKSTQGKSMSLEEYMYKFDLDFLDSKDKVYKNASKRVLYLYSVSNKKPYTNSEYTFTSDELKHGLFYNTELKLWQTSIDNKSSLSKYTEEALEQESDSSDHSYEDSLSEMSMSEDDMELAGMSFKDYGKGLLMKPNKGNEFYGQKYFHGGYWNKTLGGWVFSKSKQESLENLGAAYK